MRRLLILVALTAIGAVTAAQAAPLATPAKVTPPSAGKYKGKTTQKLTFTLTISRKHIVNPSKAGVPTRVSCPNGSTFVFRAFPDTKSEWKIDAKGYFYDPYSGSDGEGGHLTAYLRGQRSGSKGAKGTMRVTDTRSDLGGVCDSGVVKWTAKRR